jgi:hypothetical protein
MSKSFPPLRFHSGVNGCYGVPSIPFRIPELIQRRLRGLSQFVSHRITNTVQMMTSTTTTKPILPQSANPSEYPSS